MELALNYPKMEYSLPKCKAGLSSAYSLEMQFSLELIQ